jgi:D-aspartate ligase
MKSQELAGMTAGVSSLSTPVLTNRSSKPIGAIVFGGDYQGLGIVRSLGRRKIPVCVIDDEWSIARYSRYATHSVAVGSFRDERHTVQIVMETARRLDLWNWVLYPTRDETVAAFARYREELKEYFRVATPGWNTTQWVWDKRNTYSLAQKLNISVPKTWYPKDVTDLDDIAADLPLVIKPAIKEHFFYATKAKAWRANSRRELAELFQRAVRQVGPGEAMIQDLIPGNGEHQFAYCAFFKQGQAVGSMVVRRVRQHPPEFGRASTYVETIDLPILEQLSERFLRAIDYYGLVELEYKLDPRDGEYKLLDVNGRTWGYHTLGLAAGVDFPYLLFADQVGDSIRPCRGRVGVRWIRLLTDVPTSIREIVGGRQKIRAYVRSVRNAHTEAVFSQDDPLPGLAELALFPYLCLRRGF